jgi:H+/Cl- antiporter ClcA
MKIKFTKEELQKQLDNARDEHWEDEKILRDEILQEREHYRVLFAKYGQTLLEGQNKEAELRVVRSQRDRFFYISLFCILGLLGGLVAVLTI